MGRRGLRPLPPAAAWQAVSVQDKSLWGLPGWRQFFPSKARCVVQDFFYLFHETTKKFPIREYRQLVFGSIIYCITRFNIFHPWVDAKCSACCLPVTLRNLTFKIKVLAVLVPRACRRPYRPQTPCHCLPPCRPSSLPLSPPALLPPPPPPATSSSTSQTRNNKSWESKSRVPVPLDESCSGLLAGIMGL